ncbi:hypothetical protein HW555_003150 [Spodoptera exigua]|uniref:Uncharacterized protein n=1 Tax=Spodoptera exigua TaxID=7107 RepID=A0A835GME0_SPOEX|nr:hypothetical protein HW555_003150 [Spodoptera exigua]
MSKWLEKGYGTKRTAPLRSLSIVSELYKPPCFNILFLKQASLNSGCLDAQVHISGSKLGWFPSPFFCTFVGELMLGSVGGGGGGDGGQVKEDEHVASYKPIPESDGVFIDINL